jgi:hypothetical protein
MIYVHLVQLPNLTMLFIMLSGIILCKDPHEELCSDHYQIVPHLFSFGRNERINSSEDHA